MSKPFASGSGPIRNPQSAVRNLTVPLVDLKSQYQTIKADVETAFARILENTSFVMGREVAAFEKAFAEYLNAEFCIGVNSGTAAMQLALMASDIGPGRALIGPSFSFFATGGAVSVMRATSGLVAMAPGT